jgi:hypothetical protein
MSADLYRRVLWWNGSRGLLKEIDVTVELHAPPTFLPDVEEVDFGQMQKEGTDFNAYPPRIRLGGGANREMEAPEITAVRVWLNAIRGAVAVALRGKP